MSSASDFFLASMGNTFTTLSHSSFSFCLFAFSPARDALAAAMGKIKL
jgi:hypothetical protein